MVQLAQELLDDGHQVFLVTTTFDLHRVQTLTSHLNQKKWKFNLVFHEQDKISREDFLGTSTRNFRMLPGAEEWAGYAINCS